MHTYRIPMIHALLVCVVAVAGVARADDAPALRAYSQGLGDMAQGKWADAATSFASAQEANPRDGRFPLAHAVAVGLGGDFQKAVSELSKLPRNNRTNREPELWTYVFETMGGFATDAHRIGGPRLHGPQVDVAPNEAVSMPGHMMQGGQDYPTDFASFIYQEMALQGYATPRERGRSPDAAATEALRRKAGQWFAARFQASPDLALAHLELAKQFNAKHDFVASLDELHYALIPYPRDWLLAYYIGDNWLGIGRPVTARRELTYAATGQPTLAWVYLDRALAASRVGDAARAKADFAVASRLNTKDVPPFGAAIDKNLAATQVRGEPLGLLAELEKAVRDGKTSEQTLAIAQAFHRSAGAARKRYDESYQDRLRVLTEAVAGNPKSADALVELAKYLTDESDISRRGEAVEPRQPMIPYRMNPDQRGELERAVSLCDQALKLDDRYVRALMQKAFALSSLGRDGEAEPLVNQALEIAPKDPQALKMRADYWMRRAGAMQMQAASLRTPRSTSSTHTENRSDGVYDVTVTTYYPPTPEALARATELDAAAQQLYQQADTAIQAALEVTKGTFDGLLLQADVQFAHGQARDAEATLKKAIAKKPDSLEANQALTDLYIKTGQQDQAILQESMTANLFQTTAGWLLKEAWTQIVDRKFADAMAMLEQARKLDPEDARVPAYLGVILRDQGKAAEADVQFRLALAMEEGRVGLDSPPAHAGPIAPYDPQGFGLAMRLRGLIAAGAKPEQALALYRANTAVARLTGPGGLAAEMYSAMLPQPGVEPIPVPAPVNMATLIADSHVAAGKALQALGRTDDAMAEFQAATAYGPKAGIARVGNGRGETNFSAYSGGQTAEAYMELAKQAISRGDYKAAASYMSQATDAGIPREKMQEANDLQMQISQGMSNQQGR